MNNPTNIANVISQLKVIVAECDAKLKQKWPESGISSGIAHSRESDNVSDCLALADQRMYENKKAKQC